MENSDNTSDISIEEIDFSKYRTKELATRIGDLVSLPKTVGKLVVTIVVCVAIGLVLIYAAMKLDGQGFVVTLISEIYAIPASILVGIALWLVLLIHHGLSSLTRIVDLMLETTVKVAADYQELGEGGKKLPPMDKLIGAVHEHIFTNIVREVISSQTGFLGRPIFWAYQMTLGRMLKVAIRFVATQTASQQEKRDLKTVVTDSMTTVAEAESQIIPGLQWARQRIVESGAWLTGRMLWPCYLIIAVILALLIAPIVAVLIFS